MLRALAIATAIAAVAVTGCSGSSGTNPANTLETTTTRSTDTLVPPETSGETTPASIATDPTTTATTSAPTTTIDDAAILADAEAAYLEAFQVAKDSLRNPADPTNDQRLRDHFTDGNLDKALENLRLTVDGNYVAKENPDNPSLVRVVEGGEFIDGDPNLVRLTVCEFNSDRIYEIGTAPDGGDSLVRDDPVSLLFVTRMEFIDGHWKSKTGGKANQVRDEVERCTEA